MNEYEFTLTFDLPDYQADPERYLDALFQAGCDDAVVGTGLAGTISLEFLREAETANEAIESAISNVMKAIPGADLAEAKPDLVGLTDVAEILACSRQNIRKYMDAYREFPRPAFTGKTLLWHLWELASFQKLSVPATIVDISKTTFKINMNIQQHRFESGFKDIA